MHQIAILTVLLAAGCVYAADLSKVPQIHETEARRDERMQWFRDAKFGMFIHWGPCSVGEKEIGWGREGNRPWDINRHGPRTADSEYDNYYKEFNPTKYNADEWVRFAKASGMKYMVLITKHHDGFSQFDSKLTDYDIMAGPYRKDIVGALAEACHRHGMKLGLYYSTRDWYHPDYLVGDNKKYDAFYRGQVRELLSNYGRIDIMWFDHVGGRDWGKWKFDDLFTMMYELQPKLIVNNRAARFCGPKTESDQGPPSPEIEKMTLGDYYTPEGRIGSMDIEKDWESCIHVGQGWSYRGEDGFKGPDDCIRMLVSCTTGGGNLLLNFGPRPDGTFADGEARVAVAMGKWLKTYGEAIYGTRAGPYKNGEWGGSCHKGKKLYLHVYDWPKLGFSLDPISNRILSARTLTGEAVTFEQTDSQLSVDVRKEDRDAPVTVIELTMEKPVVPGRVIGGARLPEAFISGRGKLLSEDATLEISSNHERWDHPVNHPRFLSGKVVNYAFHTKNEKNPWAKVDLGAVKTINLIEVESRPNEATTAGLIVSLSLDGKEWEQVWRAVAVQELWQIPLTHFHAGIDVPGRKARYIKLETRNDRPRPLLLKRLRAYGKQ